MKENIPELSGLILDLGCGSQPFRPLISKYGKYVSADLGESRKPMVVCDASSIPCKPDIFNSVVCSEVLEHVLNPISVLAEINRILDKNGKLLLTVPMSWGLHYEPHDYWRFTPYGLSKLLTDNGFRIIKVDRIGGLFALIGSRLVEGVSMELWKRLSIIPKRGRHLIILLFSIPVSILFYILSLILDPYIRTDAISHSVLAIKI